MEQWDPEKEKQIIAERQKKLNENYRETMKAYLKMYGYDEFNEPDTFFVFMNKENGLKIRVYKYRGQHAWMYRLEFFNGDEKMHIEDPVKRDDVGNVIIDTEGMLLTEIMRKGFNQTARRSFAQQSLLLEEPDK